MMISKYYAECAQGNYIRILKAAKKSLRNNFEEMDLKNVKLRDEMEQEIIRMENSINLAIQEMYEITFE